MMLYRPVRFARHRKRTARLAVAVGRRALSSALALLPLGVAACGSCNSATVEPRPGASEGRSTFDRRAATSEVTSAAPPIIGKPHTQGEPGPGPFAPDPPAVGPASRVLETGALLKVLERLRRVRDMPVSYRGPSRSEAEVYRRWVKKVAIQMLSDAPDPEVPPEKTPAGFRLRELEGGSLWLLSERRKARRGAGAVLLRGGAPTGQRELLIEAPHTFFDTNTLPIAVELFQRLSARALLINTIHRGAGLGPDAEAQARKTFARSGHSESDVAHVRWSFFNQAHTALVETLPGSVALQLHGYSDATVPSHAAVVSAAGTALGIEPFVAALRKGLSPLPIAAYPRDVRRLGGTTNRQAKVSRARDGRLMHLELSRTLRDRSREDPKVVAAIAAAVERTLVGRAIAADVQGGEH